MRSLQLGLIRQCDYVLFSWHGSLGLKWISQHPIFLGRAEEHASTRTIACNHLHALMVDDRILACGARALKLILLAIVMVNVTYVVAGLIQHNFFVILPNLTCHAHSPFILETYIVCYQLFIQILELCPSFSKPC